MPAVAVVLAPLQAVLAALGLLLLPLFLPQRRRNLQKPLLELKSLRLRVELLPLLLKRLPNWDYPGVCGQPA